MRETVRIYISIAGLKSSSFNLLSHNFLTAHRLLEKNVPKAQVSEMPFRSIRKQSHSLLSFKGFFSSHSPLLHQFNQKRTQQVVKNMLKNTNFTLKMLKTHHQSTLNHHMTQIESQQLVTVKFRHPTQTLLP